MKDFFENDTDSKIPENLEWQNMEQGILDKMKNIEKAEAKRSTFSNTRKRYALLMLLFISLMAGLTVAYLKVFNHQEVDRFKDAQANEIKKLKTITDTNEQGALVNQQTDLDDHITRTKQKTQNEIRLNNKEAETKTQITRQSSVENNKIQSFYGNRSLSTTQSDISISDQLSPKGQSQNHITGHNKLQEKDATPVNDVKLPSVGKNPSALPATADSANLTEKEASGNKDANDASSIAVNNKFDSIDTMLSTPNLKKAEEVDIATNKEQESLHIQKQFILEGGLSFWDDGTGNSMPNRDLYEQELPSFQIQGIFQRGIKKGFYIMTGFQYQQLESRFEYSTKIPDYVITFEDTVVQVRNDLATGRQEFIYGDVKQTVEAERNIIHYNTTRLLKLSLGSGKSWRLNSMQADIYLGGTLNALAWNQGRTFLNDEIIDYNNGSGARIENSLLVEAFVGARIHYFVDPRLAITGSFQIQKSLMNWSTLDNARLFPVSGALQLGMSYSIEKP